MDWFFSLFTTDNLNNYFDSIQVITLPQREQYVKTIFKQMDIAYIQFNAIQGTKLNIQDLIRNNILSKSNKLKHINEVACYMSHITLISNFYDNSMFDRSTVFIFEDDILLDTNFLDKVKKVMDTVPSDWEFINFGRCWDNCKDTKKISDTVGVSDRALCAHSYAITKSGARKILQNAYPIIDPVDVYYTKLAKNSSQLKFYSAIPRIFNQMKSLNINKNTPVINKKSILTSTLDNDDSCKECMH